MSDAPPSPIGQIGWVDLTVPNAVAVRDFYQAVAGWQSAGVSMGDYEDFGMTPAGASRAVAGICHARGMNADIPPQWLIYITVADLDASIAACTARGGAVIAGPHGEAGAERYCIIRDPAGAIAALYQAGG